MVKDTGFYPKLDDKKIIIINKQKSFLVGFWVEVEELAAGKRTDSE